MTCSSYPINSFYTVSLQTLFLAPWHPSGLLGLRLKSFTVLPPRKLQYVSAMLGLALGILLVTNVWCETVSVTHVVWCQARGSPRRHVATMRARLIGVDGYRYICTVYILGCSDGRRD